MVTNKHEFFLLPVVSTGPAAAGFVLGSLNVDFANPFLGANDFDLVP